MTERLPESDAVDPVLLIVADLRDLDVPEACLRPIEQWVERQAAECDLATRPGVTS